MQSVAPPECPGQFDGRVYHNMQQRGNPLPQMSCPLKLIPGYRLHFRTSISADLSVASATPGLRQWFGGLARHDHNLHLVQV